jgi:Tol biopolymer transport system component
MAKACKGCIPRKLSTLQVYQCPVLRFSSDWVYYLERTPETATLFRVSTFGTNRQSVLDNVSSPVSFSPDGSQMAFVRYDDSKPPERLSVLMTANKDGTDAKVLLTRDKSPDFSWEPDLAGPIWHPKEDVLLCPTLTWHNGTTEFDFEAINLKDLSSKKINDKPFSWLTGIAWLNDGNGFIAAGAEQMFADDQLYLISYPDGQTKKLLDFPYKFTKISLTNDGKTLLTTPSELRSNIWFVPVEDVSEATPFRQSASLGIKELSYMPGGQLLFTSRSNVASSISQENFDGQFPKYLTTDNMDHSPVATSDGRYIFFVSHRAGSQNVWRMNSNGTDLTRITFGSYEDMPQVTSDNQWIIYHTGEGIWKMPFNGGEAEMILKNSALYPAISPDGKYLGCFAIDSISKEWVLEVISLSDSSLIKSFNLEKMPSLKSGLRWTPDSEGLSYVVDKEGVSNIWIQSLNSGKLKRKTEFKDSIIFSFAWSPNGNQIACSRGTETFAPILLHDFLRN